MKTLLHIVTALGTLMVILPFVGSKETYARWEIGARDTLGRLSEAAAKHAAAAWLTICGALAAIGVFISHHLAGIFNASVTAAKQHPQEIANSLPTIIFWIALIVGIPLAYVALVFLVHKICHILATFDKGVVAGFSAILAVISHVLAIFVEN